MEEGEAEEFILAALQYLLVHRPLVPVISPCPFVPAIHLAAGPLTTKCNLKTVLGTLRATYILC